MSTPPNDLVGGICKIEENFTSGAYPKRPVALTKGRGATVWDADGNSYLDLTSGQGVALLGHCHPRVSEAITRQAERQVACPEIFHNDQRAALYEQLAIRLPAGYGRFFLCNSGAEAVEGALKLARVTTGRKKIVAFQGGFHGRTLGALTVTWNPGYRRPFEPLLPHVSHLPFNDTVRVGQEIDEATAAVIVEPVQGESGVRPADPQFLRDLRSCCDRTGALLIFDEIQTGLGRTGRWFAFEHHDVEPDVLCLGKGLAGGLPMGAIAWRRSIGRLPQGSHGSTFGGNPVACAAARATLEVLEEENLPARAAALGEAVMRELTVAGHRLAREIRGQGLMIGIDLRKRVTPVLKALMERGVLALPAGPTVLRLLPPLTISSDELARGSRAIMASFDEILEGEE